MRYALAVGMAALLSGCAGFDSGRQQWLEDASAPVMTVTHPDGSRTDVRFEAQLFGRGCHAFDITPEGVSYVGQQDASSDWSSVRGIVSVLPETVAVVLNPISSAVDAIIAALSGRPPMDSPSEIHGCEGVEAFYETNADPPE